MSDTEIRIEPWKTDCMGRKGVAKFLESHLDANDNLKVLNLNSPWGSGKTYFLNNWKSELESQRACVYFNAWERDFTGDAFVSLVAAIREQLDARIGPLKQSEDLIKSFTQKASQALIAATPALAKGLVKKITGVEVGVVIEAIGEDTLADAAEKAVEKLIESNKESIEIVEDFKRIFAQLLTLAAETVATGESPRPVYLFIDELDRCRPTFAIELLERIKHLFDVPGCKFIIATDTTQLGHAVKAIYGSEFSANKYLKRFFDAEFKLDNSDISQWVAAHLAEGRFKSANSLDVYGRIPDAHFMDREVVQPDADTILSGRNGLDEEQMIFLALAKTFRCQFRELEKILVQISAVRSNSKNNSFRFYWAAYLVFLKDEAPDLYDRTLYGDWNQALKDIESRYPPKKLYFASVIYNVHQIFGHHLQFYRNGENYAKAQYREISNYDQEFLRTILGDFKNHYLLMASYPRLVDLAHSLE